MHVEIAWVNYTLSSNNSGTIIVAINISNPGIYPLRIHNVKVYTTLNGEQYNFATITAGSLGIIPLGEERIVNRSKYFVHEPTTTAFELASNNSIWEWRFSIDVVFDLGFLQGSIRSFRPNLNGTANI